MITDATADVVNGAKSTLAQHVPESQTNVGNPVSAFDILKFRGHIPGIKTGPPGQPEHEFSQAGYKMPRKMRMGMPGL